MFEVEVASSATAFILHIALSMDAASTCETSVSFCEVTLCNIPENTFTLHFIITCESFNVLKRKTGTTCRLGDLRENRYYMQAC
jgi:hypothetical protein